MNTTVSVAAIIRSSHGRIGRSRETQRGTKPDVKRVLGITCPTLRSSPDQDWSGQPVHQVQGETDLRRDSG
jgi:hypothetical protein